MVFHFTGKKDRCPGCGASGISSAPEPGQAARTLCLGGSIRVCDFKTIYARWVRVNSANCFSDFDFSSFTTRPAPVFGCGCGSKVVMSTAGSS